jgi:hypothetical protein
LRIHAELPIASTWLWVRSRTDRADVWRRRRGPAASLDGVNVDFEGRSDASYPYILSGVTRFMRVVTDRVHQRFPAAADAVGRVVERGERRSVRREPHRPELYYDDAGSLGLKYDLVNGRGLRGTGMWARGTAAPHATCGTCSPPSFGSIGKFF